MKHMAGKKQQGVVLIWALAILLILTILGISSVKKANMGTKIAGNSMASMMVFQGAESALGKTSNLNYVNEVEKLATGQKYVIPRAVLPDEPVSGGNIKSTGTVMSMNTRLACPTTGIANSSSSTCVVYKIEVESRLQGTGAKTQHVLGVAHMVPSTNFSSN